MPTPALRTSAAALGVMLAIAGAHHGVLELWQGNKPTGTPFLMAVAVGQLGWQQGTEGALSLLPTFLLTGVVTLAVALAIAAWSIVSLGRSHGALGLLLLFILLTLVGGGIGHIAFFVPLWAYATRINRPLDGWRKMLPRASRAVLAKLWPTVLTLTVLTFLIALEISIFGIVAGLGEESRVLYICWSFLGASWLLLHGSFICAAASDLEQSAQ